MDAQPSSQPTYWFKRRRYGYGWTPASRQGWMVLGGYLCFITVGAVLSYTLEPQQIDRFLAVYVVGIFLLTALLIAATIKKGPSPKWRWGSKQTDNPTEDF